MSSSPEKNVIDKKPLASVICFFAVALSLVVLSFYRLYFWTSHPLLTWADQSVYLEMGKLLLAGQCPYKDFFDFNPPLIMYLSMIPVVVSRITHWPVPETFAIIVHMAAFISVALSLVIAYTAKKTIDFWQLLPLVFAFALAGQSLDTCLGEREHLFLLLYLPYFILRGVVWQKATVDTRLAILVGLLAGIGLAFKPYFLFAAALTDFVFYCRNRQYRLFLRPENYACAAFVLLYLTHFLFLPQPAFSLYLQQIVPIYNEGAYWSSRSLIHMMRAAGYLSWPFIDFLLAIGLALFVRSANPWLPPAVAFTCAGLVNYFVGDQAWTYRLLPMMFGTYMIFGLLVGMVLSWLMRRFPDFAALRLLFAFLLLGAVSVLACADIDLSREEIRMERTFDLSALGYNGTCPRHDLSPIFFAILQNTKISDPVICIGTGIEPGYPALLQAERRPGSRYIYSPLSFVEYAVQKGGNKLPPDLESRIVQAYGNDINRSKPTLILVQDVPIKEILQRYDFYRRYMQNYRCIGQVAEHSIFKRNDGGLPLQPPDEKTYNARAKAVLMVLSGQKSVSQASAESGIDAALLKELVEKSKSALDQSLLAHPADQVEELLQQNKRLVEKINALEHENQDLRLRLERGGEPSGSLKMQAH